MEENMDVSHIHLAVQITFYFSNVKNERSPNLSVPFFVFNKSFLVFCTKKWTEKP